MLNPVREFLIGLSKTGLRPEVEHMARPVPLSRVNAIRRLLPWIDQVLLNGIELLSFCESIEMRRLQPDDLKLIDNGTTEDDGCLKRRYGSWIHFRSHTGANLGRLAADGKETVGDVLKRMGDRRDVRFVVQVRGSSDPNSPVSGPRLLIMIIPLGFSPMGWIETSNMLWKPVRTSNPEEIKGFLSEYPWLASGSHPYVTCADSLREVECAQLTEGVLSKCASAWASKKWITDIRLFFASWEGEPLAEAYQATGHPSGQNSARHALSWVRQPESLGYMIEVETLWEPDAEQGGRQLNHQKVKVYACGGGFDPCSWLAKEERRQQRQAAKALTRLAAPPAVTQTVLNGSK